MKLKKHSILRKLQCLAVSVFMTASMCVTAMADTSSDTYTYNLADLDVAVTVTEDLVGFTQNMTSNNSYLDKIGASDVEEVRAALQLNNIYLELIPKEGDVDYEILLSGKKAPTGASNFDEISQSELEEYFNEYIESAKNLKESTDAVTETITDSGIVKLNNVNYFMTEVTSVSGNLVTVYLKKYYTIMQGKAVVFTLQTNQPAITEKMNNMLTDIINTADYKPIKKTIMDNPFFVEIMTSFLSLLLFVGVLALILFLMLRVGKKKKR